MPPNPYPDVTTEEGRKAIAETKLPTDWKPGQAPVVPKPAEKTYHMYKFYGHAVKSDHLLTKQEVDHYRDVFSPPLSQIQQETPEEGGGKRAAIATAIRIGGQLASAPFGKVGRAIGGAVSEVGAELVEQQGFRPKEVGAMALESAVLPRIGKTAIGTVAGGAAYGAATTTIDSIAKDEGLPSVGQLSFGALVGGVLNYGAKWVHGKLEARSALREVLPKEVVDEAHPILTEGKLATPPTSPVEAEEVAEVKRVQQSLKRDARGRFLPRAQPLEETPVQKPRIRLHVGDQPHEVIPPQGPKGKTRWVRTGKGEWIRQEVPGGVAEPPPDAPHGAGTPIPPDEPTIPNKVGMAEVKRPAWLFNDLGKETGLPLTEEVWRPVHDNIGNPEKLNEVIRAIDKKYMKPEIPKDVQMVIKQYVQIARGAHDNSFNYLASGIQRTLSHFPGGDKITRETAKHWARAIIGAPYTSLLGFRPSTALWVFSHTFQAGYMKLGHYIINGMAEAFTPGGYRKATQLGFLGAEYLPEEALRGRGVIRKALDASYYMMRKGTEASRAIIGLGSHQQALNAIRRAGGDVEKFARRAGLNVGIPEADVARIKQLFVAGEHAEAARLTALAHVENYTPGHTRADRPMLTTGTTLGQVVGGLSNWPSFYGTTLKRNFFGPTHGQNAAAIARERGIMFARWVAANAAIGYVDYKAQTELYGEKPGKKTLEKVAGHLALGPIWFAVGPTVRDVVSTVEGAKRASVGLLETAASPFVGEEGMAGRTGEYWQQQGPHNIYMGGKQVLRAAPIPFKYAAEDAINVGGALLRKTLEDRNE